MGDGQSCAEYNEPVPIVQGAQRFQVSITQALYKLAIFGRRWHHIMILGPSLKGSMRSNFEPDYWREAMVIIQSSRKKANSVNKCRLTLVQVAAITHGRLLLILPIPIDLVAVPKFDVTLARASIDRL